MLSNMINLLGVVVLFLVVEVSISTSMDKILRDQDMKSRLNGNASFANRKEDLSKKNISLKQKFISKDLFKRRFLLVPEIIFLDLPSKTLFISDEYELSEDYFRLIDIETRYYSLVSGISDIISFVVLNEFSLKIIGLSLSFIGYSVLNSLEVAAIGLLFIMIKSIITSVPKLMIQLKYMLMNKNDSKFNIMVAGRQITYLLFDYSLYVAFISGGFIIKLSVLLVIGYIYRKDFSRDLKEIKDIGISKISKLSKSK